MWLQTCLFVVKIMTHLWFHRYRWAVVSPRRAVPLDSGGEGPLAVCRWRGTEAPRCRRSTSPEGEWRTLHRTTWTVPSEEEKKGCRSVLLISFHLHLQKQLMVLNGIFEQNKVLCVFHVIFCHNRYGTGGHEVTDCRAATISQWKWTTKLLWLWIITAHSKFYILGFWNIVRTKLK